MMKKLRFLAMGLMIHLLGFSQSPILLTGKISNSKSEPIAGASVVLLNSNAGATTDSTGNFRITHLNAGRYTLHVSAIGYASADQEIEADPSRPAPVNVRLFEEATHLDAVVVTAEKKEELLQRVPVSVSSLSSRQVKEYRIWNSKDLTAIVPNLYSANPGDQRNVTSIRGITSTSYDPAVATYVDGVNQFSLDTYIAQLFDVERIEVLRGPQGTLYGRNAMGGVINIITRAPSNHMDGYAEINFGNYGEQRYHLGFRAPLVKDRLFLGVAGMYEFQGGYYTNVYNQSSFDRQYSIAGNLYLKYIASPRWNLLLNLKNQDNRNNGVFPLAFGTDEAFAHPYEVNQNAITKMVDNTLNASFSAIYSGPGFNFSSQTAYQSNYRYYTDPIDADFSPIDGVTIINNYGKPWNKVKAWTQEFKFNSPANSASAWKWTGGAYFFYQDIPSKQATHFGKDAALVGSPDSLFSIINTTKTKRLGLALYAQASYSISRKLSVTAGLRYDYENDQQDVRGQYQKDPDPNPVFDTRPDTSGTTHYSAVSPKLGLDFPVTDNNHIYLSYSRGFRSGGLTALSSDPSQPPLYAYKPEFSGNFELGSKNIFWGNRLRANISLFYTTITDAQVPTLVLPDAITVIKNAGKLSSKGLDLELAATPLKGFSINYSFGYTHAVYDDLKLSQNGTEVDLAGKRQIFTPETSSMLALQYGYRLSAKKDLTLLIRGEWMNLGDQYFDLANTIKQPAYSLFNARLGVEARSFGIFIWGRNLADKKYIAYAYDFGAVHLGNPLTYGITLTARIQ